MSNKIILASKSKVRKEILDKNDIPNQVEHSNVDEDVIKDALIKFRQATVKDPNSWKAAYWVGKCHYQLDNFGYALKYANTAISLKELDKKSVSLVSLLSGISKEEFLCYSTNRSIPQHWNF